MPPPPQQHTERQRYGLRAADVPTGTGNFYDLREQFWREHCPADDLAPDGNLTRFRRWEWFWEQRVAPSGEFPDPEHVAREWRAILDRPKERSLRVPAQTLTVYPATWEALGPTAPEPQPPFYRQNTGRMNIVKAHPTNPQLLWAGAAGSGLWKSTNGGQGWQWVPVQDDQITYGISDIDFDPLDPNVLYATTGECDAMAATGFPSADPAGMWSQGVLKSVDGGLTWTNIGLGGNGTRTCRIGVLPTTPYRTLVVARVHPVAAESYVWRKVDDGVSPWTRGAFPACCNLPGCGFHCANKFIDLEVHPTDPQVAYASTSLLTSLGLPTIFRTVDAGVSWSEVTLPTAPVHSLRMATTPAQADLVVAVSATDSTLNTHFYASVNKGATWTERAYFPGFTNVGGFYALEVAVDVIDPQVVYLGGLALYRSFNGGFNWVPMSCNSSPAPHPDTHGLTFYNQSGTSVLFQANDGGIARITNPAGTPATCEDLSVGLSVTQFYKQGTSPHTPHFLLAGAQDNGNMIYDGIDWSRHALYGDGTDCLVSHLDDPAEPNDPWTFVSNAPLPGGGKFWRCDAAGGNCIVLAHDPGYQAQWVQPLVQHPDPAHAAKLWIGGWDSVEKSDDFGLTWTMRTGSIVQPTGIAVFRSDPAVLYMVDHPHGPPHHHKSLDGGETWVGPITDADFPSNQPTSVVVHPKSPDLAWVGFSGFPGEPLPRKRVMKTADGGVTWADVSDGATQHLPRYPVNAMTYLPGSPNGLFVGTDLGVYYRDDTMTDWILYDDPPPATGLPKLPVMDVEFQRTEGLLRAATWGRGVWQAEVCGGERKTRTYPRSGDDPIFAMLAVPSAYVFAGQVTDGALTTVSLSKVAAGSYDPIWGPLPGSAYRLVPGPSQGNAVQAGVGGAGYVVVGTGSGGPNMKDVYFLKTDANGIKEFDRELLRFPNDDEGWDVRPFAAGASGYAIACTTFNTYQAGKWDALVLKVDGAALNPVSYRIFTSGDSKALAMDETSDGGFVVATYRDLTPTHDQDVYVFKTLGDGNPAPDPGNPWRVPRVGIDTPRSIHADSTGYAVAGWTQSSPTAPRDAYVVKLSTAGAVLWSYVSNLPYDDAAYDIEYLNGDYLVAGTVRDDSHTAAGAGDLDTYFIRLRASDGAELWRRGYGWLETQEGRTLAVGAPNEITVGGSQAAPGAPPDHMLLGVDDCPGITP